MADDGLTPQQRWNRKNPEKMRGSSARWRAKNLKRHNAMHKKYKQEHRSYYVQLQLARQRKTPALTQEELTAVYDYYGADCVYCGGPTTGGVDHLHPVKRGGTNDFYNLAPCCRKCNSKKQVQPIWVMLGVA